MASFSGNIDLLSLNGAKVLIGLDEQNAQRPYVCIPLDVNEIRVETSKNDASKQVAKMRVIIDPFNDAYKNKIRQSNAERGDTNKSVPTHEMKISYSADYIKAVAQRFPKLVEQVKEAVEAGADIIMLDNMTPEMMKEAVDFIAGRAQTECSGNITKENIKKILETGVDFVSSGALTHSAPILDISMKNLHAVEE